MILTKLGSWIKSNFNYLILLVKPISAMPNGLVANGKQLTAIISAVGTDHIVWGWMRKAGGRRVGNKSVETTDLGG